MKNTGEGSINEILLVDSILAAKGIEFTCENDNYIMPGGSLDCTSSAPYIIEQASSISSYRCILFSLTITGDFIVAHKQMRNCYVCYESMTG